MTTLSAMIAVHSPEAMQTAWRLALKSVMQPKDMREILEERRRARDANKTPAAAAPADAQPKPAAPQPVVEPDPMVNIQRAQRCFLLVTEVACCSRAFARPEPYQHAHSSMELAMPLIQVTAKRLYAEEGDFHRSISASQAGTSCAGGRGARAEGTGGTVPQDRDQAMAVLAATD